MSKKISIVNAGGIYAQTFLKSLKGFNSIALGDLFNNRSSLHQTVEKLKISDPSVNIENLNINSPILLERLISDSNTVVYFTHDYFSNTQDKNKQLLDTVEICKSYNVNKVIAVSPLEYINYYDSDGYTVDPFNVENNTHNEALQKNNNLTILRTNLVFGTRSYLLRYMTQYFMENINAIEASSYKNLRINPIYYNDLNDMVRNLVKEESNGYRGKKLIANGAESLLYNDIHSQLRQTYTPSQKTVKNRNLLIQNLANNWQLFFHGNTHVTNFKFMLNFLNSKSPQFADYENASILIGDSQTAFKDYYTEKAQKNHDRINLVKDEEPEDLRYPALQNYYKVSLD